MELNCNILHLEDDDNDSFFFQRALGHWKFSGNYRRVASVDEAIGYLTGRGDFADRHLYPLPHLLVADSNLGSARTTGDLLAWLRAHPEFRFLRAVMLTGGVNADVVQPPPEGVVRVLPKGAKIDDLVASVGEVLKICMRP
jgi:hypothetical protein